MAGAAFLRARTLLRDQVITQTQGLMTAQIQQMDLGVKTKNRLLDQIVRLPNIAVQIGTALKSDPKSTEFSAVRRDFYQEIESLNIVDGKATFNEFILLKADGTVLMASNPAWEGISLKSSPAFNTLLTGNDQSYALYDLASLYPNQMVLATIVPYLGSDGALAASWSALPRPRISRLPCSRSRIYTLLQVHISLYPGPSQRHSWMLTHTGIS